MERVAVIEVCDRHGRVIERFKATQFPLRIGRACDNDLIIDDPYVCPHHCEIALTESGQLIATDLASINGLFSGDDKEPARQITLDGRRTLRLGHTRVRLRFPEETLEPTRVAPASESGGEWPPRSLLLNAFIHLLAALVMTMASYLNSFTVFDYGDYFFSEQLPVVIAVAAWAAVWSIVSRITQHRFAFFSHVTILVSVILVLYLAEYLLEFLKFGFAAAQPFELVSSLFSVVALSLLFFWHLRLSSEQGRRRLLAISTAIAVMITALVELDDYLDAKEFSASPALLTILKPPASQLVNSESLESFMASAERLRVGIEEELGVARAAEASQPAVLSSQ